MTRTHDPNCMIAVVDPDHRCRAADNALRVGATYPWCFEGQMQAKAARERIEAMERHDAGPDGDADLLELLGQSITVAMARSAARHPSRRPLSWSEAEMARWAK